jgi:hypothetical protein
MRMQRFLVHSVIQIAHEQTQTIVELLRTCAAADCINTHMVATKFAAGEL